MKTSTLVLGCVALATVNAAMIPPPISEASHRAFRDPTSDITEDAKAGVHPYDADVYIAEDSDRDTLSTAVFGFPAIRSKRQFGGFGLGGSGAQAAANSFGGGYGGLGYPGGFGAPAFGSPVGSAFGSPGGLLGGGGGFGGLGGYGGLGGGSSGSSAQSSSSAFGAGGGLWG